MMFKKRDVFIEKLYQIALNVRESATFFNEFKITSLESVKQFADTMKEFEHKGDSLIHALILALNNTFITSIEREDILNLAVKLDDILDGMEACASRFFMYDIIQADNFMVKFAENIELSTEEIVKAMQLLLDRKLMPMREFTIRINEYESEADEYLRTSIRELFRTCDNAIQIMKYKDVYEILEGVSDSCEDVADTLETIIMRNS